MQGNLLALGINEHQISDIDNSAGGLSHDKNRILFMNGVNQQ